MVKMQNFLEEFYRGIFNHCESSFQPDPDYKSASTEVVRLEEQLTSRFNEEEKELYQKFQLAFIKRSLWMTPNFS